MILGLEPAAIAGFMGAGILLNLTPGADVMFASASGLSGGVRAGVAAAFGVALGGLFHTLLAAIGLAALLAASPLAYHLLSWAGAGYLVYLAIKAWRAGAAKDTRGAAHLGQAIRRGFVTNALNPKVALFILALLPQFTAPAAGPVWAQILLLGTLFSVTGFVITAGYGAMAGHLGTKTMRFSGVLNRTSALVYALLALRLVTQHARA